MFLSEAKDTFLLISCVHDTEDVYTLVAGFPIFKLNACVGIEEKRGEPVQVVLDTGAEQNLVREDFLPNGWEQNKPPLRVRFAIVDANGRRISPEAQISLLVRMGKTSMRANFFVMRRLAVSVLWGCAFARRHLRAIFPMDDKVVLTSEETFPFAWRAPRPRTKMFVAQRTRGTTRPPRLRGPRRLRLLRIKIAKGHSMPPGYRSAVWVSAPVNTTHLFIPRAERTSPLQWDRGYPTHWGVPRVRQQPFEVAGPRTQRYEPRLLMANAPEAVGPGLCNGIPALLAN